MDAVGQGSVLLTVDSRRQLPAFLLEDGPRYKHRSQRLQAGMLPLCLHGSVKLRSFHIRCIVV